MKLARWLVVSPLSVSMLAVLGAGARVRLAKWSALLSVGLFTAWHFVTFVIMLMFTEHYSILGTGPLPHTVLERFLLGWAVLASVWFLGLLAALVTRLWAVARVACFALASCAFGAVIDHWLWVK